MERREFIAKLAVGALATYTVPSLAGLAQGEQEFPGLKQRKLGNTGHRLSMIGFGGIVVSGIPQEEANETVKHAIERGVNYFDVAPTYGNAEERLGPALEPYREDVFLACKTQKRTAEGAAEELRQSLEHLRTDHLDLYQLHALTKMEDLETALGPGGAMEAFQEAREKDQVKFLGFSAHSVEVAMEALNRFDFDTILFPVNFVLYSQANFGPQVVKLAEEKGVARLALKAMARTRWAEGVERGYPKCWYEPVSDLEEADQALRFTLSESITAAIPPGDAGLFRMALDLASHYEPIKAEERQALLKGAEGLEPLFHLAS